MPRGRACGHLLDTLLTPFVTTKAHGLGISLTIGQSIVHAHQGTIAARNNPGDQIVGAFEGGHPAESAHVPSLARVEGTTLQKQLDLLTEIARRTRKSLNIGQRRRLAIADPA